MGVSWTREQQKVIDLRNRNLLVSAAAGSGKTAVLVERIIKMITDEENPVDIDKLLVVTFTNAAAGEMRERISDALEKKLSENPDNEQIQKQLSLIHNAHITTIHSFCLYVIRNHFHMIDLDPSFRVGDEGELKLLRKDVVEKLIEDYYEEGSERFYHFVESYSPGKSDSKLEELILELYTYSMSSPWPEKWLIQCKDIYEIDSFKEMEKTLWMKKLKEHMRLVLKDGKDTILEELKICLSNDGPYMYEDAIREDEKMIDQLLQSSSYDESYQMFYKIPSFSRLSSKKDEAVSDFKRNLVKTMRDKVKDMIKDLKKQYFYQSPEEVLNNIKMCKEDMNTLVEMTLKFKERYSSIKLDKNLVDFNDLEHFALNILVQEEEGETKATPVAMELSEYFEEIMIDEYQDSNLVQEMILTSVSGQNLEKQNIFMVGDVKQSIYRFRLARPEIFMEKYETYTIEDSSNQRIDLHKNFRSRGQILNSVNFIFEQIMGKSLGNIEYDKDAALYQGADFPGRENENNLDTELLLIDLDTEILEDDRDNYTSKELEAMAVAKRIKELTSESSDFVVLDKTTKEYRKAEYKDIVILLRTISGWSDIFASVLMEQGIPVYTGSQTGYFSTIEIRTILMYLNVIDNPIQDIPLAASLKSPIGGFSGEELAVIKSCFPDENLYDACLRYSMLSVSKSEGKEKLDIREDLCKKLGKFFDLIDEFRSMVPYTGIHDLLWCILEKTGYGKFVEAMPGGEQRKANMDMLVEKALVFETTSYKGLFNFVRYIEYLQKYEVDFGEAGTLGENDNTVKIMSIHKSKGLEFPVVFVSGLGKNFNKQDTRSKIVLHPDLGMGADFIDPEVRVKAPTLIKKVIGQQTNLENLGEELRVLYVALTRAKEKLIMTGGIKKLSDKLQSVLPVLYESEKRLLFSRLSKAATFLDWILPALIRHPSFRETLEQYSLLTDASFNSFEKEANYQIRVISLGELTGNEILNQITSRTSKEELIHWDTDKTYDEEAKEQLAKTLSYKYPYDGEKDIHTKITVTELKRLSQPEEQADEIGEPMFQKTVSIPLQPKFLGMTEEVNGATRGTVYHKVLQNLDFTRIDSLKSLKDNLDELLKRGMISREMIQVIEPVKLYQFFESKLGKRMTEAEKRTELHREQPFVIGIRAKDLSADYTSSELILIQGIIDAYFIEDGKIVLVDYKTDYVSKKDTAAEEELIKRYGIQLQYYEKALERFHKMPVKEKILYSFGLQKEIWV